MIRGIKFESRKVYVSPYNAILILHSLFSLVVLLAGSAFTPWSCLCSSQNFSSWNSIRTENTFSFIKFDAIQHLKQDDSSKRDKGIAIDSRGRKRANYCGHFRLKRIEHTSTWISTIMIQCREGGGNICEAVNQARMPNGTKLKWFAEVACCVVLCKRFDKSVNYIY